jgi:hypothetical protein
MMFLWIFNCALAWEPAEVPQSQVYYKRRAKVELGRDLRSWTLRDKELLKGMSAMHADGLEEFCR